jgi:hypothetical protein
MPSRLEAILKALLVRDRIDNALLFLFLAPFAHGGPSGLRIRRPLGGLVPPASLSVLFCVLVWHRNSTLHHLALKLGEIA